LAYGLVADPTTIEHHINALAGVMPGEALRLISDQLHTLVTAPRESLGIGLFLFGVAALLLIAGVPAAAANLPMPEFWRQLLPLLRWPLLALLALLGV